MEVDAANLDLAADGHSTGWVLVRGRRLLADGSKRAGKELVHIAALPGDLRIRHQGAAVEVRELQQTHGLDTGRIHKESKGAGSEQRQCSGGAVHS
jgi:hypothetical protein